MIAAACLGSMLPPQAFGLDDADVVMVGDAIMARLMDEASKQQRRDLLDQLKRGG